MTEEYERGRRAVADDLDAFDNREMALASREDRASTYYEGRRDAFDVAIQIARGEYKGT